MKQHILWAIVPATFGVVGTAWLAFHPRTEHPYGTRPTAPARTAPRSFARAELVPMGAIDHTVEQETARAEYWQVEYDSATEVLSGGDPSQSAHFAVRGELRSLEREDRDGHRWHQWSLVEVEVEARLDGVPSLELGEQLERALALPYHVRTDEAGDPTTCAFDESVPDAHRQLMPYLLAAMRVEWRDGERWEVRERDPFGSAHYVYEHAGDHLSKTRVDYLEQADGLPITTSAEGRHRLEDGRRVELDWRDSTRLEEPTTGLVILYSGVLHAKAIGTQRVDASELAAWDELAWYDPRAAREAHEADPDSQLEQVWRQRLQGTSVALLVADLAAMIDEEGVLANSVADAREALGWYLRLHPESLDTLHALLLSGAYVEGVELTMLSAIGSAQSAEAQALLATFANGDAEEALARGALDAMFQLEAPTPELLSTLDRLAREPTSEEHGTKSLLVLGALSGRAGTDGRSGSAGVGRASDDVGGEAETEAEEDALEELIAREAEYSASGRLATWLSALGNARDPRTLPTLGRYLEAEDPRLRSNALHAIARTPGPEARDLALGHFRSESSLTVRTESARLLATRADVPLEFCRRLVDPNHPSALRREGVAALLGRPEPEAATLVTWLGDDSDPAVAAIARGGH